MMRGQIGWGKVAPWAASLKVVFWGHRDGKCWWPTLGAGVIGSDVTAENGGGVVSAQSSQHILPPSSTLRLLSAFSL